MSFVTLNREKGGVPYNITSSRLHDAIERIENPENVRRYLYTMSDYMEKPIRVKVNSDEYVTHIDGKDIEPIPIEDYGDYYLSETIVSDPFERWKKGTQ